MQHIQRILTQLLRFLKSPFTITYRLLRHRPFTTRASIMPQLQPATSIFSLPAELHFQILSYLPFSSHVALASTHPFFNSLLQDSILRSKRYYSATYPGIHILFKDYTLRVIIRNNDVNGAKVEVLQLQPETGRRGGGGLKSVVVANLNLSAKRSLHHHHHYETGGKGKERTGGILDDYWLWVPLKRDVEIPENMDLKKLVILLQVITPVTAAKKEEDKRTYWSTEYPFRIARPSDPTLPQPPSPPLSSLSSTKPPVEPATLKQMVTFIAKRVIRETGLKNEKEVRVTLRVCKLGGKEGYVGFTGEVEVEGPIRGSRWGRWFGR
ncbi:hypothetical protein TWF718_006474 [Orbilia javanica]|uniref:F-box domain-containing protein n=1 Tax=Orbilia javanica TaxID=47235 RepID=A0AAN8RPR7_9PEZI